MALDPTRQALAEALDVCASVSKSNLAKRGELLPFTLVNPYALRRLADALEALVPGAIDSVREAHERAQADAADRREATLRALREDREGSLARLAQSPALIGHGVCEARVREGVCGWALDAHGYCDRAGAHIG